MWQQPSPSLLKNSDYIPLSKAKRRPAAAAAAALNLPAPQKVSKSSSQLHTTQGSRSKIGWRPSGSYEAKQLDLVFQYGFRCKAEVY